MKSKRYKQADGHKDNGLKPASLESLRARVEELEREGKRREEELSAKEQQIKTLQEQLLHQSRVLEQLSHELQTKSVHINKLQDGARTQGGASTGGANAGGANAAASRPPSLKKSSPNLSMRIKETLNRRKGAKAGVSAEPTSRTYDSSALPKFSFEKARVPKDAR